MDINNIIIDKDSFRDKKLEYHEIKVIAVGGAGNNAINRLAETGINGVDLIAINTDLQDLQKVKVPIKIQIGKTITEGLGAGSNPEIGRNAVIENLKEIEDVIDATTDGSSGRTQTVIIVAGMGGGTGTGAAPVIAKACADRNILTIGMIMIPDITEGEERYKNAELGLEEIKKYLDSLIVVDNTKLANIDEEFIGDAYGMADMILYDSVKAILDIRTKQGIQNIDHADLVKVLKKKDKNDPAMAALIGSSKSKGENRAMNVIKSAINSPLLKDNDITGANWAIFVTITNENKEDPNAARLRKNEKIDIVEHLNKAVGKNVNKKWGYYSDENYTEEIELIIVVAGFNESERTNIQKDIIIPNDEKTKIEFLEMENRTNDKTLFNNKFDITNFEYLKDLDTIDNNINKIENK